MARRATIEDLEDRVAAAVQFGEEWCRDVADAYGQIFENVEHMRWFRKACGEALIGTTAKYYHLAPEWEERP